MRNGVPCPLETSVESFLRSRNIRFSRPETDQMDRTNLDFYLPDFNLYIEVKLYHTPRIAEQLSRVPEHRNVMVLVGRQSFSQLVRLFEAKAA